MKVSYLTLENLKKAKEKEIEIQGYKSTQIETDFNNLISGKVVEVGFRTSCGKGTDKTLKVYREWIKLIKNLRKDGFFINEETVKHDNKSPTMANGFWNSIKYKINN